MKPKIYIETTIPSYLTSWPSRDIVTAARQQMTREWWERRLLHFDPYISEIVVNEAAAGDIEAAARRLESIETLPLIDLSEEALKLARELVEGVPLPEKAAVDALHIAVAVTSAMEFLVTWNCTHIANAENRNKIEEICRSSGYEPPIICTPEELMGE